MQKVFYLKTCGTCKKIMSMFDLEGWELQELKTNPITEEELEILYKMTNSYEALFSKRSTQIRVREIDIKALVEKDFKELILEHYSFLKRPIFVTNLDLFIGSDKKTLGRLSDYFGK